MKEAPAIYCDRVVSRENFRAFIYGHCGKTKLVNSWDEYEAHISTGIWFDRPEEVKEVVEVVQEIKKPSRKASSKKVKEAKELVDRDEVLEKEEMRVEQSPINEPIEDNFLPRDGE